MRNEPPTRERYQIAARLFFVAALLNVLACLLYVMLHRWLFVAIWGALAGVNSALTVVYGTLASRRRLL